MELLQMLPHTLPSFLWDTYPKGRNCTFCLLAHSPSGVSERLANSTIPQFCTPASYTQKKTAISKLNRKVTMFSWNTQRDFILKLINHSQKEKTSISFSIGENWSHMIERDWEICDEDLLTHCREISEETCSWHKYDWCLWCDYSLVPPSNPLFTES